MREESTAVTSRERLEAAREEGDGFNPPCAHCGLRNPVERRSCLACGVPLTGTEGLAGALPVDTPLVEREQETAALDAAIERYFSEKRGALVAITAPRGYGATRLLRYGVERLLHHGGGGVRILSTTVREADGPYAPITRLLWERFGLTPTKSPALARSEVVAEVSKAFLARKVPPTEHARRIIIAAGLAVDETGRWEANAERDLPRLADSVARLIAYDAEVQPVAVFVDRLDGATEEGLALMLAVVQALASANAPVLVVVAGDGSKLPPALMSFAQSGGVIEPKPLSRDACEALCHHLLPGLPMIPEELLEAVVTRAEGIPGKARGLMTALVEGGVIVTDEVPWRVELEALGPHGPISTADLLQIRLAQIDEEARAVLERAAVVGEVFWEGAVVAMTRIEDNDADPFGPDAAGARVHDALRRLAAARLVTPIEESELALQREYVFDVPGLREMLQRTQLEVVKRRRHDVCASWLELASGPRADDLSRAIAGHLDRAGLKEAASRAYLRAARAARSSYRGPQAVDLFDRGLRALPDGDAPTRVDALHDKGVVLSLLGRVDEAEQTFTEMLRIAHIYGARNKEAAALGRLGRLARGRGEIQRSKDLLERALELFREWEDQRGIAAVEDDLGMVAYISGDYESATRHSQRALEMRRELDDPLGEALSTHNLGLVHLARGQPRQARAYLERALTLREKHQDVEGAVVTRNVLAVLAYERGDIENAERMWEEIQELAETLGDRRMIAVTTYNLGEAAILRGNASRARQRLDAAEALGNELDDKRLVAEVERGRGMLAKAQGDAKRARGHLERSRSIAHSIGAREAEGVALRGLGEVCAMTVFESSIDMSHEAEGFFVEAVRILDELGATRELARTRAAYGQYQLERGETMGGRKLLTLAVPVLERLELAEAAAARIALKSAGGEVLMPKG